MAYQMYQTKNGWKTTATEGKFKPRSGWMKYLIGILAVFLICVLIALLKKWFPGAWVSWEFMGGWFSAMAWVIITGRIK